VVFLETILIKIMTMALGGGANQTVMVQMSMPWDTGKAKAKERAMVGTTVVLVKAMAREATKVRAITKVVTKEVTKAKVKAKETIRAAEVLISRETPRALLSLSAIAIIADCEVAQAGTAHQQGANMRTMGPVENAESMGIWRRYATSS